MLREIRAGRPAPAEIIERSVTLLAEHVASQRHHFAFIARERASGPPRVREAVRHQLQLFEGELATDLARLAPHWSTEDLQTVSHLIVGAMVTTVEDLLAAGSRPEAQRQVIDRAIKELRMIVVGVLQWRSDYKG